MATATFASTLSPALAAMHIAGQRYPAGFERAGGARLPLKLRRESVAECEEKTHGITDRAKRLAIVSKIVRGKWEEAAPAGMDLTNFSFGAPSVQMYEDPDVRERTRRMLAWVPTTFEFAGCLDDEQAQVWRLSFSIEEHTHAEIAARIGKSQGAISKMIDKAATRLNGRYRELRAADRLPLAIVAWVKTYVGDDSGEADLYRVVELLRQRDRARERGRPPVSTGCKEMDALNIRAN